MPNSSVVVVPLPLPHILCSNCSFMGAGSFMVLRSTVDNRRNTVSDRVFCPMIVSSWFSMNATRSGVSDGGSDRLIWIMYAINASMVKLRPRLSVSSMYKVIVVSVKVLVRHFVREEKPVVSVLFPVLADVPSGPVFWQSFLSFVLIHVGLEPIVR